MKTKLCPMCGELITFLDDEDYRICPKCGETVVKKEEDLS